MKKKSKDARLNQLTKSVKSANEAQLQTANKSIKVRKKLPAGVIKNEYRLFNPCQNFANQKHSSERYGSRIPKDSFLQNINDLSEKIRKIHPECNLNIADNEFPKKIVLHQSIKYLKAHSNRNFRTNKLDVSPKYPSRTKCKGVIFAIFNLKSTILFYQNTKAK